MKNGPVGVELFRVDGQTRRLVGRQTDITVDFRHFGKAPTKINTHPTSYVTTNTLLTHYKKKSVDTA